MEEAGLDPHEADLVLGTSAGAAFGAQLTSGVSLGDLYARQVDPARQAREIKPRIRYLPLMARLLPALLARHDKREFRVRIGRMARATKTVEPAVRLEVMAQRLPSHEWPDTPLAVAAIDAESGEERWFDATSGVGLVEAVTASCAVPGVWPPTTIGDRSYYDGGLPSPDNLHRAVGYGTVLVLAPVGGSRSGGLSGRLEHEISELEATGSRVMAVVPDAAARTAFGRNPLDPAHRPASAKAGLEQGRRLAPDVLAFWK